jgi:hypothetical protein
MYWLWLLGGMFYGVSGVILTSFDSQARDPAAPICPQLCWSSPSSFFSKALWTSLLLVVVSRGPVTMILWCGPKLTDFFSLLTGRPIFLMSLSVGSLKFYRIILFIASLR